MYAIPAFGYDVNNPNKHMNNLYLTQSPNYHAATRCCVKSPYPIYSTRLF